MSEDKSLACIETKAEVVNPVSAANLPLVPIKPEMIRPVVTVDVALDAWHEYQGLKTKLADKGDFVNIQGKMHPTKQFANKLSRIFGLSVSIVKADKELGDVPPAGDTPFTWHVWVRATAPNGQFRESDGHCSSRERKFAHIMHDVYATAVTRAKNRAILELAGFGEVTAEEITDDDDKIVERRGEPQVASQAQVVRPALSPKTDETSRPPLTVTLNFFKGGPHTITMTDAMTLFEQAKAKLGEETYRRILGECGYENKHQLAHKPEDMSKVWDALIAEMKP